MTTTNMNIWKDIYYKNNYITSKEWFDNNMNDAVIYYSKYIDELPSMDFMIINRINGYFQELESIKESKNIIHSRSIINNNHVEFIWIFLSSDIPQIILDCNLYPCCTWNKITKNNPLFELIMFEDQNTTFIDFK